MKMKLLQYLCVPALLLSGSASLAIAEDTEQLQQPTWADTPFANSLLVQDPPAAPPVLDTPADDFSLPETIVQADQDFAPAFEPDVGAGSLFGSQLDAFNAPGSGFYIDSAGIQQQRYGDIGRVLRRVPGVYIRDETGFGNFPTNISLRGVDTTRSAKITIMEDGILTAPAPYASPSAYYFPNVDRMHAIEVYKGHSQIRYGPHTTGGAINMVSTLIPEDLTSIMRMQYGRFNDARMYAMIGNTMEFDNGRVGYLVEGYYREADGFRTIDASGDFRFNDTTDTGFSRGEPMLKLFWEPDTCTYQRWEVKAGYTDFEAAESSLGLSESDVINDPFRRYTAARFDNIDADHVRTYLRYTLGNLEDDCWSLTATAYYNKFNRNWYKLHDLRNIDTDGDGVGDGVDMSLSQALVDSIGLQVLQGTRVGTWGVRNNDRYYRSYGYEAVGTVVRDLGGAEHTVSASVRFHADQTHPFQDDDEFTINDQGMIVSFTDAAPGSQRDRIQEVSSVAAYLVDDIKFGNWVVSPGIRLEHLNLSTVDFLGTGVIGKADLGLVGGGVGTTYDLTDSTQFLAGFHRGFSPPNPRGVVFDGLQEEEALASEAGFRYMNQERAFGAQLIGFYTHFNDVIAIDNIGGTGTGTNENFGSVYSGGIEFFAEYDLGIDRCWGFRNPIYLSLTWTDARVLQSNAVDPNSIFSNTFNGARVPVIPEWQVNAGIGYHFDRWGADFSATGVSKAFGSANNQLDPFSPGGLQDARFGTVDSFFMVDMNMYANLSDAWQLFGGLQNALDNQFMISRQPHGPRVGLPLYGYMGLEATF